MSFRILAAARLVKPKRPKWLFAASLVGMASLLVFLTAGRDAPWVPGRRLSVWFGAFAAAILSIEALYPWRRRLTVWPLDSAQRWLQFHIYGGCLLLLFVAIHVGFRWPAGTFGRALLLLTVWSVASGLVGVLLQKRVPVLMTAELSVEAMYDRLPELTGRLQSEADLLMSGTSAELERMYRDQIRPMLAGSNESLSHVWNLREARRRGLLPLEAMAAVARDDDRNRLEDLTAIVTEKLELDAQSSLQRLLRQWLVIHVPTAFVLAALVALHLTVVWSF